ncbi:MAG: bifunctional diaminohydroxyphosphoribosylaminopyrimidine deaminase/5-amino-6-(5-phosphoribosylamino)uracil reductase RibD [Gemmatimonadetes bacterium]|nr:bifunctional diaminohydroxyphosphoribosylaminopyrimidine deaminase/5-amino-6-(5-phosphoribosylamino)uracil reductase RibD [Gemmatimonadota bacterium]
MAQRDHRFMAQALGLAPNGWGRVHPNPLVGAVVASGDETVGSGWHAEWGGPHAELLALREAGLRARGADLYVTLEPCAHHGKTPPCTQAIVQAGIRRVVFAVADPTQTAGGGAERLREAGIEVVEGVGRAEARSQNRAFFHVHERAAPYVALKLAQSIDGRISRTPDAPTPLTGALAREDVFRLRAGFDALLIGVRTVRSDDPLLTARGAITPRIAPVRVVLDTSASTPTSSRMLSDGAAPVWIVAAEGADERRLDALRAAGARTFGVRPSPDGVDVVAALAALRDAGLATILCEGGGRLAASLLAADAVERLYLYIAPVWLGDAAVPAFAAGRPSSGEWTTRETGMLGPDVRIVFDRAHGDA